MPTSNQEIGDWGEQQVAKLVPCQVCHEMKLTTLAKNFPSLDLVCRNCGSYLAQVKSTKVDQGKPTSWRPTTLRGAGWRPLQVQMSLGAMRDLYVVGGSLQRTSYDLRWIDRVPGAALLANAHIFEHRVANIGGGARRHEMFSIAFGKIPAACVINVYTAP